MMIDTEQYSFQLILHSGNARSTAYEALQLVKSNAFKEGEKKLSIAKEEMVEAQKLHAKLLRIMANQEGESSTDSRRRSHCFLLHRCGDEWRAD